MMTAAELDALLTRLDALAIDTIQGRSLVFPSTLNAAAAAIRELRKEHARLRTDRDSCRQHTAGYMKFAEQWQNDVQVHAARIHNQRAEIIRLEAEREALRDALLGVMGLVGLVAGRPDLPAGLDDIMLLSHRMTTAKTALDAARAAQAKGVEHG